MMRTKRMTRNILSVEMALVAQGLSIEKGFVSLAKSMGSCRNLISSGS